MPCASSFSVVTAARGAAGAVVAPHRLVRLRDQAEAVAADAGHGRLDHAQHRDRGDSRIGRGAAGFERLDRRERSRADARSRPCLRARRRASGRADGNRGFSLGDRLTWRERDVSLRARTFARARFDRPARAAAAWAGDAANGLGARHRLDPRGLGANRLGARSPASTTTGCAARPRPRAARGAAKPQSPANRSTKQIATNSRKIELPTSLHHARTRPRRRRRAAAPGNARRATCRAAST